MRMVGDFRDPVFGRPITSCVKGGYMRSVAVRGIHTAAFTFSLLFLLAFASIAKAEPETIAGSGTGAGQVLTPRGTAVFQETGDLYVADYNFLGIEGSTARISKFDSAGNFLLAWGWGVADKGEEFQTCGPEAVPPTSNCVTPPNAFSNPGPGAINPDAVAVDQFSVSGDVYVVDRNENRVTKFSSSGEFLFMVGKEVNLGGGAPSSPGNICTAEHLANGDTCGEGLIGSGPNNEFSNPSSLAVDISGVVWVGDENRITSFNSSGVAGSEITVDGCGNVESLALDSAGNFFVKCSLLEGIRKLEAGTGVPLETLDAAGQARTVTLDEADNVYVGDATSPYRFKVYNPAGEQFLEFGAGQVIKEPKGNALAIGESAERLYAASNGPTPAADRAVQAFPLPDPGPVVEKQGAKDLLPTEATLTATINPEGDETTYRFEYGTSNSYGQSTPLETLAATDFEGEDVEEQLEGLLPDTTYHFRVVATNHCNPAEPAEECTVQGEDQTFRTPPAVLIAAQWASDVTAHSAILRAELDPLGVEAEAWLEYGTTDSYGQIIPLANLGDGFGLVPRQASLTGLQAATTYHFHFVARDERDGVVYTVQGPDRTFTTQVGGLGFELADNRVWEMVSPTDKQGAKLLAGGEVHLQGSADGDALAYQSKLSIEEDPEGNRIIEASMNLARRNTNGSWSSKDIATPNDAVKGIETGNGTEYKLFSSDLSEALVEPRGGMPLSPEASERTPYLRKNTSPPVYVPLVTGKEPFANVPPGIEFGGTKAVGAISLGGASPDFQHFAFVSGVPLVEGPALALSTYEWSDGQIRPVSVLPAGEGGALVGESMVGSGFGSTRGAVSEDGSRVFWSSGVEPPVSTALYVRDTEAEETGRLDIVQPGADGDGTIRPIFQGASADGSVVFFTDSHKLTEGASLAGFDLYRCELPTGSVASGCATLTDISVPIGGGESAAVQGVVTVVTDDGKSVYFVAEGILDETPNDFGESAVSGERNLYHWEQGEGVNFIATLADEDLSVSGERTDLIGTVARGGYIGAFASPSGRYLAFLSERSLTGYDNRDTATGVPAQEAYRYDSVSGELECLSCNPTGARPESAAVPGETLVNPLTLWAGQRAAAVLPQASVRSLAGPSLYRPRAVLDNGRVFFNAIDPLVAADSNGQWDVYQYEPTGVGDCLASSSGASVARAAGGCVSLLSSGTAEEEAAFLDASETGDDVFFFTSAQLSVLDEDSEVDIYDARVNGVRATLPISTECLGEACQPPPQAPNDPTPASAAFNGAGNVRPAPGKKCPKGKRRVKRQGKVRCVARKKQQRPSNGPSGQRRAGSDRRVTR